MGSRCKTIIFFFYFNKKLTQAAMLDLGFVSAILPNASLDEVLAFAAAENFKCIEAMCWPSGGTDARRYAGVTHIDVQDANHAKIKQLQTTYGVYISGLGYYPNPLDPDKAKSQYYIDHICALIEVAAALGIPVVNTFIGRNPNINLQENIQLFKKLWRPIIEKAKKEDIKIGIENCPMWFTEDEWPAGKNLAVSPAVWSQLFEIFPTPLFGLNYDPSHMIWQMMDPLAPIYNFKERLHHIHLKDAKLYPEKLNQVGILANPLQYHSPKLPGLGDVPWGRFFAALTDVRYRGPVVIEVEDKAYEGSEADVKTGIRTARNYLSQFLG
jgi:sugar phosphate isomerase/epimerase